MNVPCEALNWFLPMNTALVCVYSYNKNERVAMQTLAIGYLKNVSHTYAPYVGKLELTLSFMTNGNEL